MPAITTRGAASAKGFGFTNGGATITYIEDVFSTYLYTGNGGTQTITNGIDLAAKGGLVWTKARNTTTNPYYNYRLYDSARVINNSLVSNSVAAGDLLSVFSSWNANGFTLSGVNPEASNSSAEPYASWTFRKQPKFFDIVTYTGTGSNTTIAHSLGSVPGSIIVKRTDTTAAWAVYHRSLANTQYLVLNTTAAVATGATWWNSTTPTSSVFSVGTDASVNASGGTYVAYIYAHDAGGFGLTGADNVISCGTFTTDGSGNATVNLGYEPQWIFYKESSNAGNNWNILDSMRGFDTSDNQRGLNPNTSGAENNEGISARPSATGFTFGTGWYASRTFIYIAIRRGPMKVPTVGTSVFAPQLAVGDATASGGSIGFPADLFITAPTAGAGYYWYDRLRGRSSTSLLYLTSTTTGAESSASDNPQYLSQNTVTFPSAGGYWNSSGVNFSRLNFRRTPGFFDEVCYTGTGGAKTETHNLGAAPELIIVKPRSYVGDWYVLGQFTSTNESILYLNLTNGRNNNTYAAHNILQSQPTSSAFALTSSVTLNTSADTYVAYLFATLAGISKVGSYTGNGSNQTIACGFTAGSRFVMIKRTDSTGDWYVWDSARGIVAGNDPHISFNTTAVEVTTDDSVDTDNSGFIVNQLAATNVNVTSATYIFLAIA